MIRAGLVALLLIGGCAARTPIETAALPPQVTSTPIQAIEALPATLGGFQRTAPKIDYESEAETRGLGASARYVPVSGEPIIATVFIYDRGQRREPDGGEGQDVQRELQSAYAEVSEMVRTGHFSSVTPGAGTNLKSDDRVMIRCGNFTIGRPDGSRTGDTVCVTINQGRFVKIRLSAWNMPDVAAGMIAGSLLSTVINAQAGRASTAPSGRAGGSGTRI